jgi:hypothetical protein
LPRHRHVDGDEVDASPADRLRCRQKLGGVGPGSARSCFVRRGSFRPPQELIVGRFERSEPPAAFRLDRERNTARLRRGPRGVDAEDGAPDGAGRSL